MTPDDDDVREELWMQGHRAAYGDMLATCCRELGYDDPEAAKARWIPERELAINALRRVCEEHGDNDWLPNLHLADIIEKHLHRHLEADRLDRKEQKG